VNGYAKKMRYGIETTSPHAAKVCFGHKVLRWFYDFEKDIRIEEIIFVYENKKEDVLCILMRKICFELCEVSISRPHITKVREGRP
jgi:hypothetical protein